MQINKLAHLTELYILVQCSIQTIECTVSAEAAMRNMNLWHHFLHKKKKIIRWWRTFIYQLQVCKYARKHKWSWSFEYSWIHSAKPLCPAKHFVQRGSLHNTLSFSCCFFLLGTQLYSETWSTDIQHFTQFSA